MKNILNKMKYINKKMYLIIASLLLVSVIAILSYTGITNRIKENRRKEEIKEFEYETYSVSGNVGTALVILENENGLEKITYTDLNTNEPIEVFTKGKTKFAFDYKMEDRKQYEIRAEFTNGEKKTYTIDYEIPRIKGTYKLVNGLYANEPDSTRINKRKNKIFILK